MKHILDDIKLLKKYHTDLVFDYTEYPTKSHWTESFGDNDYKNALSDWLPQNQKKPILFYVHTPFCEQLCYFCLCSKEITQNYEKVKEFLYEYKFKEIELLESHLNSNKIKLNTQEIYFGGGSPTYYKEEEFKALIDKLKSVVDFSTVGDFTVEIDPRRVDEERLLFYSSMGVNRLSFGIQDFDPNVQEEINRIQTPELVDKLLTKKVREAFPAINFDLLIGLPSQTTDSIQRTIKSVIDLQPTQLQTMYMHYKPQTRKYMINMLRHGALPDFYDRKAIFAQASEDLLNSGYTRAGFESYSLPNDILTESIENKKAYYASLGTQKGEATNFIAVGSSAHGSLGNEYYFQNYYEQNLYRNALKEDKLPIYRGMKLNNDDKIRQKLVKEIRTYFEVDFNDYATEFDIDFNDYFKNEIDNIRSFQDDGLLSISDTNIKLTEIGVHFSPQVANVFDAYDDQMLYKKKIA